MGHTEHHGYHHGETICPACDIAPFTRNNYFTGKLMLERDFTDESRYHIDKLRHHHQRLHGWGVVCGLKVKQHEQEKCRSRFICIEPGSAIDCCGHEIVVHEEECIDIMQFEAIKALDKIQGEERRKPRTLQIRICYRECPTEEIPVLYDECGCDDTKCAPNRILESYDFDVVVNPPDEKTHTFHTPKFKWENSVAIAHAARVALHDASHRLYVLTGDDPATVYQVSTDNHATITSRTLPAKVVAQAVSNDGKHLYVVVEPTAPATLRQLHVLDTTQAGMPDFNTGPLDLPNSSGSDVSLAVAPDGHLLALVSSTGDVLRWPADLDTNATPAPPDVVKNLGAGLAGLTLSGDGKLAFALGPGNKIQSLDLTTATVSPIAVLPVTAKPSSMALVSSTAPDMLAVADQTNLFLHLVALTPAASLVGSVKLDHPPIGVVAAPGGHWAYVLEKDADSFVQAVSLHGLLQKLTVTPGKEFKMGKDSRQIIISESGARLYIPFVDDLTKPAVGGVAIVEVSEQACEEILWRQLEGCPHCDTPECLVLATIENYHLDDKIEDLPAKQDDPSKHMARIDNRKGRRLLPSTEILKEYVECLLDHGPGGAGQQGPPGERGPRGEPGVGERGPQGPAGPGLETDLTQIVALSWRHNRSFPLVPILNSAGQDIERRGIVIGFSKPVTIPIQIDRNPADHVFEVLVEHDPLINPESQLRRMGVVCRCALVGSVIPVKPDTLSGVISSAQEMASPSPGLAFVFDRETRIGQRILEEGNVELWVRLRGDFVIDINKRAVDSEFVRAELPSGDRPSPSADPTGSKFGIQGGFFESWFEVKQG